MKFNKNFHIVALFAAMIALNAQATPVSSAQACRAVSAWAAANGSAFANPGSAVSAEPEYDVDGVTKLYYKVKMSNGGLVIASPDTDLDLVVAVLENSDGNFPKGHPLPSILKADMRNRLSVIAAGASAAAPRAGLLSVTAQSASAQSAAPAANLPDDVKESMREANAQWEKYGSSSAMRMLSVPTDAELAPYIRRVVDGFEKGGRFTHWNQSSVGGEPCYNYYTPNKEVCGCVATAGAAIMQFFGNTTDIQQVGPVSGVNCSLYGQPIDKKTLEGAIDWSILPKSFGGASEAALDEVGRKLLGRVTYNFGVLVGMGWASEGPGTDSGSYVSSLAEAFKKYGFDTARAVTFNTEDTGTSQYFKMVYAQNWAGAPVVLGIHGEPGGHAVVACGYAKTPDDEELCRVFMGWGGSGDAWYKFPTVQSFSIVNDAVTMIGFDASKNLGAMDVLGLDEAGANDLFNKYGTVPICGKSNLSKTKLTFPGVTKGAEDEESGASISFTLTAEVDENGFFAVRIPANTTDLRVVHEGNGAEMVIDPFDSKVLKDEKKDRSVLEAAMPGEMLFLVLNTTVKSTVASARARAIEDGKAVLMISGAGGIRESLLVDYITYLDSNSDVSNKFVFVRLNSNDYSSPDGDGDPSIGIFDPTVGSADFRWWSENGRLAYNNFINYDASNLDELHYVFDGANATSLTNIVNDVLAIGYDKYARRHSGIEVAVRAIDEFGNPLTGLDGVEIPYGVHTKCWLQGDVAEFSAPEVYTNEVAGISFKCLGWVTNGVSISKYAVTDKAVSLTLSNSVDFAWIWRTNAFRVVSSVASSVANAPDAEGAVTPAVAWVAPRDRVTIMAKGALYGEAMGLNGWDICGDITGVDYNTSFGKANTNGRAINFSVYEPVHVTAMYRRGESAKADPQEYSVNLSIDPPELAEVVEENASLNVGSNSTYDKTISLAPFTSSIVDSTGGVWKCLRYVSNGVTNSIPESEHVFFTANSASLQLVWELQVPEKEPEAEPEGKPEGEPEDDPESDPEDDPEDDPEGEPEEDPEGEPEDDPEEDPEGEPEDDPEEEPDPVPGPISVKTLSRSADGEWSIAVEGAVKGCWYTLYAADDISKLAGSSDSWTAEKVETVQATADGESIVFKMTPTANAQFWRVKASGTNE